MYVNGCVLFGASIYIHSNSKFPITRLTQLCGYMKDKYGTKAEYVDLSHITIKRVDDPYKLLNTLQEISNLCQVGEHSSRNVRLIVVDSIASIFQCSFENNKLDMPDQKSCSKYLLDYVKLHTISMSPSYALTRSGNL